MENEEMMMIEREEEQQEEEEEEVEEENGNEQTVNILDKSHFKEEETEEIQTIVENYLSPELVEFIAKNNNLELSSNVVEFLTNEMNYRIRDLILIAKKFQSHSKRSMLITRDLQHTLKLKQSPYSIHSLFPNYGLMPLERFSQKTPMNRLYRNLYADKIDLSEKDSTLICDEILLELLPSAPQDTHLSLHWLSINGEIPDIPQNLQIYDNSGGTKNDEKTVKNVKSILFGERKLYFDEVTSSISSGNDALVEIVCRALKSDVIHPILPFFCQFIAEQVYKNLKKLKFLLHLMKMVDALLNNIHQLNIELYLHQLLPVVFTCLLSAQLCQNAFENHWQLRNYTAILIGTICKKFEHKYPNLQTNMTKTFFEALFDPKKPLTTHYGAIKGLTALGAQSIENVLLPHLRSYRNLLDPELKNINPIRRMEAQKCNEALLAAAKVYISSSTAKRLRNSWNNEFIANLPRFELRYYETVIDLFGEESIESDETELQKEIGEVETLIYSLQNEASKVRIFAAKELGTCTFTHSPYAIEALLQTLENDSEIDVKKSAILALNVGLKQFINMNDLDMVEKWKQKLQNIAEKEKDPEIKKEIANSMMIQDL